jgi:predicted permease
MVERILEIVLPVLAVAAVGWVYGHWVRPETAGANRMNMDVFVPALVVAAMTSRDFDLWANRGLVLGGAAVVLGSGLIAWPAARLLRVDPRTFVPPMMFNNSGNMGLPLALLAFGPSNLPAAVALFVTSNLLHFTVGTSIVRGAARLGPALRSPVLLASFAGVALSLLGWRPPGIARVALDMLAAIALPLMLFTLGVRMAAAPPREIGVGLAGAVLRPLAGLAVAFAVAPFLPLSPVQRSMLYLFAGLPPAVFNFLIAEEHGREPEKVASVVLLGNLASLAFVPLALWLGLRG